MYFYQVATFFRMTGCPGMVVHGCPGGRGLCQGPPVHWVGLSSALRFPVPNLSGLSMLGPGPPNRPDLHHNTNVVDFRRNTDIHVASLSIISWFKLETLWLYDISDRSSASDLLGSCWCWKDCIHCCWLRGHCGHGCPPWSHICFHGVLLSCVQQWLRYSIIFMCIVDACRIHACFFLLQLPGEWLLAIDRDYIPVHSANYYRFKCNMSV